MDRAFKKSEALCDKLSSLIDEQKKSLLAIEGEIATKGEAIKQAQKELEEVVVRVTELRARQKVLLRLKEEGEGLSPATKRLLQESARPESPLFGKLALLLEGIAPHDGFELALAAAMRPYSQTLLVKETQDFLLFWTFAQQEELRGFSLTTPELLMSAREGPSPENSLLNHVSAAPEILSLLKRVAFLEEGALEALSQAGSAETVTRNGNVLDSRGVLFSLAQGESHPFLREAELKRLATELELHGGRKGEIESELTQRQQDRVRLQGSRSELDRAHRLEEMKLVEVNFGLQRAIKDRQIAEEDLYRFDGEGRSLEAIIERMAQAVAKLAEEQEASRHRVEKHQAFFIEIDQGLEERLAALKEASREQHQRERVFKQHSDDYQRLISGLKIFEAREQESQRQENRLVQEFEEIDRIQSALQEGISSLDKELQGVEEELKRAASRCSSIEEEKKARQGHLSTWEEKSAQGQQQRQHFQAEGHRLELLIAQQVSTCQSMEQELSDRFQQSMDDMLALSLAMEATLDLSEKEVRRLRRELEQASHVNLGAIEEFDAQKERHIFLSGQVSDLGTSRKELQAIIQQLDKLSQKQFKETFEQIRSNFQRQFQVLFEGGEADLTFTDSEDPLQAGVEIIAKPPGKHMRSISLLSGGEKCLTAMALLFAIFEVKPAPFCILDEMDAPLDDTNVERFVRVLKPFMEKTQFLIITHNKRTMAVADVLFGVSMEEKGVSKILSIAFKREFAPALMP